MEEYEDELHQSRGATEPSKGGFQAYSSLHHYLYALMGFFNCRAPQISRRCRGLLVAGHLKLVKCGKTLQNAS